MTLAPHPGHISRKRNVETPTRSNTLLWRVGRSFVRTIDATAGTGRPKKPTPVAERQQETGTMTGPFRPGSRITGRIRDEVPGPERVLTWAG